jgi:hypothetical protein
LRQETTGTRFEVRLGRRAVALQEASTAQEALIGYLRGLGCQDHELTRLGASAVAWRGAVYRAELAIGDDS